MNSKFLIPNSQFKDLSVLVTGGAGFIGSHLVDALVERGARVRVLDNFATGRRSNLEQALAKVELVEGDIRDPDVCRKACTGVSIVFHQAALGSVPRSMKDPATTFAVNATGTANVFTAAREAGVSRTVFASSSSVYGDSEKLPKKEGGEGRPLSPYALTKVMNESAAELFARIFSMKIVGLRYFNIYGARQDPEGPYAAVIPRFFRAISRSEKLTIFGDGEQRRDFTHVSDAVSANLLAARTEPDSVGRAFNVGGGRDVSINELARLVGEAMGKAGAVVHEPPRAGDVRASRADVSLAKQTLGFEASVTIEEGLRRTVESILENVIPAKAGIQASKLGPQSEGT
jgi:nucleoside-diphosphate-sugar epimerase